MCRKCKLVKTTGDWSFGKAAEEEKSETGDSSINKVMQHTQVKKSHNDKRCFQAFPFGHMLLQINNQKQKVKAVTVGNSKLPFKHLKANICAGVRLQIGATCLTIWVPSWNIS